MFMKENGHQDKNVDLENTFILMEICMMDSGKMIFKTVKEFNIMKMVINTKENGQMVKSLVLEHMLIKVVKNMRENGKMIRNKGMAN